MARGLLQFNYQTELVAFGTEWAELKPTDTDVSLKRLFPKRLVSWLPSTRIYYRISILLVLILSVPLLAIYLRRNRPDVLMSGLLPWASALAIFVSRTNTPLVLSVQGLPKPSGWRNRIWGWLGKRVVAWVIPAESISERLRTMTGREINYFVITNPVLDSSRIGVDVEKPDHEWYQTAPRRIVLGAGRLTRQKNFELLLRAFARLPELALPTDLGLVIVGEGEERESLERLAIELGIESQVSMPGHVSNPEAYMAHSDVFVLTSRWEGPGHVLIEALATGVPCVTVDCPSGPAETLGWGKFGEVVPLDDVDRLASAIGNVLANPENARLKSALAKPELGRYTAEQVGILYAQMLDSLQTGRDA